MRVFDEMGERNVLTWTSLIDVLVVHGQSHGFPPDHVTFARVLVACSHGGLDCDRWHDFESIRNEYGMEPLPEHYGCIVWLISLAVQACLMKPTNSWRECQLAWLLFHWCM